MMELAETVLNSTALEVVLFVLTLGVAMFAGYFVGHVAGQKSRDKENRRKRIQLVSHADDLPVIDEDEFDDTHRRTQSVAQQQAQEEVAARGASSQHEPTNSTQGVAMVETDLSPDEHADDLQDELVAPALRKKKPRKQIKFKPRGPPSSKRLIVVAYKLPVTVTKSADGTWLVEWVDSRDPISNLKLLAGEREVMWVGILHHWNKFSEQERDEIEEVLAEHNCVPVSMPEDLRCRFHRGFCKAILWPLFHYLVPTNDQSFGREWDSLWQAYTAANMIFAKQTALLMDQESDNIWIHGHHLMLVPSFLRKKLPQPHKHAQIGLFLHIPFPTSDVFRSLPASSAILRGILSADLCGFHTYDYARHFLSCCKRILDVDFDTMTGGSLVVNYCGRDIMIRISHVGIHSEVFRAAADRQSVQDRQRAISSHFAGRKVLLGVDELDAVKGSGTILTLQAFDRFLGSHPEWVADVVLCLVLMVRHPAQETTTPDAHNNHNELDDLDDSEETRTNKLHTTIVARARAEISRIRSRFGPDVIHVIESDGAMPLEELVAYYRVADVALFSAFWDGLNLVPFEFTASQVGTVEAATSDKPCVPGVLILSEFMGCSRLLSGVLRVNPWKLEHVSHAVHEAITMSPEQRILLHKRRQRYVQDYTFKSWANGFLCDMDRAAKLNRDLSFVQVGWGSNVRLIALRNDFQHLDETHFVDTYSSCSCRLLIFDYGGTLTDKMGRPTPQVISYLTILSADPNNMVFVVSGQERKVLTNWFSHISRLGLAAEKGAFFRWPNAPGWTSPRSLGDRAWVSEIEALMRAYTERTGGSSIEVKEVSIMWRYHHADPDYGEMQAREMEKYIRDTYVHDDQREGASPDQPGRGHRNVGALPSRGNVRGRELISLGMTEASTPVPVNLEVIRYDHQRALEVQPQGIGKDAAVRCILDRFRARYPQHDERPFLMCIGNDKSDEKMFQIVDNETNATETTFTCSIGIKPSSARYYVHDTGEVLNILSAISIAATKRQTDEQKAHKINGGGNGGGLGFGFSNRNKSKSRPQSPKARQRNKNKSRSFSNLRQLQ